MPDAVASLRRPGQSRAVRCLCTGLPEEVIHDDAGNDAAIAGTVRMIESEEPDQRIKRADVVEIKLAGQDNWRRVRVHGRNEIGGTVRLTVTQEMSGQ
jgi:hypothetical protein